MHHLKTCAFIMLLFGMSSTMLSCKSSPTGVSYTSDDLTGKWILNKVNSKSTMSLAGINETTDTTVTLTDNSNYSHFYGDQTYSIQMEDFFDDDMAMAKQRVLSKIAQSPTDTGTWSLSGKTLTLKSIPEDTTINLQTTINGNSLTIVDAFSATIFGISMSVRETYYMTKE